MVSGGLNDKDVSPKRQPRDGSDALAGSVGTTGPFLEYYK